MVDIIVIGAGTAGMTSALYALRNGKSVLVLEGENFGGQIANSPRVENYPTIKVISGSEFSEKLFEQIIDLGADFELEKAQNIEKKDGYFEVTTDYAVHQAKAVILATGVHHKKLNIEREDELVGHGISYCAVCDGAFYKDEEVVLVGDANTALQYAILLTNYCKKVKVCTWMDRFFGDKALVDTLLKKHNVEWIKNVTTKEFVGSPELTGVIFTNRDNGEDIQINCKACFVAIGQVPDNERFSNLVDLDKIGYVIAGEDCKTKTEGVFVAGDCRTKVVRQLTTAVNDGAVAATAACLYCDKQ